MAAKPPEKVFSFSQSAPLAAAVSSRETRAGDLKAVVRHYRQAGNAAELAGARRAVEGDVDERAAVFMGRGQYSESLQLVDGWLIAAAGEN